MKRLLSISLLLLAISSIASAIGIGFYIPDRLGYITSEGTAYSEDENNAASKIYPVGTILEITSKDGIKESVYVNDEVSMPPDRAILLNRHAAENLNILNNGYDDLNVDVIFISDEENEEENQGWYKYLVCIAKTNEEAFSVYTSLLSSSLRPFIAIDSGSIDVYARYIPQYQIDSVKTVLSGLGYPDAVLMDEENPYL